jgi:hypothetical protein
MYHLENIASNIYIIRKCYWTLIDLFIWFMYCEMTYYIIDMIFSSNLNCHNYVVLYFSYDVLECSHDI